MCKVVVVKLVYLVLIAATFAFPVLYCFDAYSTLRHVTRRAFEADDVTMLNVNPSMARWAQLRADITNIKLANGVWIKGIDCYYTGPMERLTYSKYSFVRHNKKGEYFTVDYFDNDRGFWDV